MRPVNLIPREERRGERAPLRVGKLAYVLVGGLVVALIAVTATVLVGNQVKDREAELASLEQQELAATQQAEALAPYAEFASMSQARIATVTSLAQSRFDWERVFRELALVLPDDVWLTSLTGAVGGAAGSGDGAAAVDAAIAGHSLAISGCAEGHESVAGFLEALKDIDGVTRVGLVKSALPEDSTSGGGSAGGGSDGGGECQTRDFIAGFDAVVAFDSAASVSAGAATTPVAPETPTEQSEIADAQAEQQTARDSTSQHAGDAQAAANLVPGVAR
jgi:Tfp pilus assembly protein PilN